MTEPSYQHLQSEMRQGVLVLAITEEKLSDYEVCQDLRREVVRAVDRSETKMVALDLGRVQFVGSVAFLPLVSLSRKVREIHGRLILCNLSKFVEEVFHSTHMLVRSGATTAPFEHRATLDEAIAQLTGASG